MKPDDLRRAHVLLLAARVDAVMAAQAVSQAQLARKMLTDRATVCRMLQGHDGLVSTWLDAIDRLGYRVVLERKSVDEEDAA